MVRYVTLFAITAVLFVGVAEAEADGAQPAVRSTARALVNGQDDRREVYTFSGDTFARATQSLVALIPPYGIEKLSGGGFEPNSGTLAEVLAVCPDERFADQPAAGHCSGVLIDDDLVLTAGHCFCSDSACSYVMSCDEYSYVFDYNFSRPGQAPELSDLDVYGCKGLVVHERRTLKGGAIHDFAVVQLDRKVDLRRRPAPFSLRRVVPGEGITVMGSPSGLPCKIDAGGSVQEAGRPGGGYWSADTDTFRGNSGSPAFDSRLNLVGLLFQGGEDYEQDPERFCVRVKRTQEGGPEAGIERFAYVEPILTALCSTAEGAHRALCAPPPPVEGSVKYDCSVNPGARDAGGAWWASLLLCLATCLRLSRVAFRSGARRPRRATPP